MRESRVSAGLPFCALLIPWIVGPGLRHGHAPILLLVSMLVASTALFRGPAFRAERLALPVLLFSTWPDTLLAPAEAALGIGRAGLVAVAATLLLLGLLARVIRVRCASPEAELAATTVLERSFPDAVRVARIELDLLRFGLLRWRRNRPDTPGEAIAFPGTASGIESAFCLLTASGLVIETPLLHLLLMHVSTRPVAWGCTVLHCFLCIYLVGYAKSLHLRPTLLFPDRLEIRLGVLARRVVPRDAIETLAAHDGKTVRANERRLFGLDEPNLRLSSGGVGILFRVDEPKRLIQAVSAAA